MDVYPVLDALSAEDVITVGNYWLGVVFSAYGTDFLLGECGERVIISYQLKGNYV